MSEERNLIYVPDNQYKITSENNESLIIDRLGENLGLGIFGTDGRVLKRGLVNIIIPENGEIDSIRRLISKFIDDFKLQGPYNKVGFMVHTPKYMGSDLKYGSIKEDLGIDIMEDEDPITNPHHFGEKRINDTGCVIHDRRYNLIYLSGEKMIGYKGKNIPEKFLVN